jgi:hypothetical protein
VGRAAGWDIGLGRREPPVSYGRRRVECPTWWWPSHFDDLYRCIGSGDAVADAGDGLDYVGGAELAAQPADCDLHRFGEGVGVLIPGLF